MNKRITSLLAVIAMLCTMMVFAMPVTIAAAEPTYPCYKDYASAMAAGHDGKNWSISTKEDWKAMRDVADVATADYFEGVTFHLTNNINFGGEQIAPMGINPNATAGFAGTIDGHGFGFDNIYVYSKTNYGDAHVVCGLFQRLSNCTFKDFGINSGAIFQGSSNNAGSTSTFGSVLPNKIPTFERVWSSAIVAPICNAQGSGLVGTFSHGDISVNVNGFVFDGEIIKGGGDTHDYQYSFGVMGSYNSTLADGDNFSNIITDFASYNGTNFAWNTDGTYTIKTNGVNQRVTSALFAFGSETKFEASAIQNVYAVKRANNGIKHGYFIGKNTGSAGAKSKTLLTDMSAVEAAWTINNNPTATNPVYFTLKDGKVRPVATKENAIIKVEVTGDITASYFVNAGSQINLAEKIGYKSDLQELTLTKGEGSRLEGNTLYLGENDTTLDLKITCAHDAGFTYTAGENVHTIKCKSDCGYVKEELCSADTYSVGAITGAELAAGKTATHSGICKFCSEAFVHDCVVTYIVPSNGADNAWDYSNCLCGRENVAHEETGAMVFGDTNKNGEIDLTDVIRLLKRLVDQTIKASDKNADVNGDNVVALDDARQIIRIWLGDSKAKADAEAVQAMVNKGNHFDAANADEKILNMDATESESETNLVSEAIAVGKGNKVTFGPVRLGQAVLGYAYDAAMKPVKLINYENVATQLTFKEGMVMVNYNVPENVKFVKFHVPATEKDCYLVRINSDLSIGEYEARANIESDDLMNPLMGKNVLTTGDSICAAAADSAYAGLKGWARRIHQNFGANVINSGVSGAALSNCRLDKENATERHQISNQIAQHKGIVEFDYILLHGGVNDAWDDVEIGTISDSFDPATFDVNTYAGGLELAIYTAVKDHGNKAAIGYHINFESLLHSKANDSGKYFEVGREICKKWGIKYLDMFNDYKLDTDKYTKINSSTGVSDKIHPNEEGYDLLQPYIDAFMTEMRPVSYDIWSKVQ